MRRLQKKKLKLNLQNAQKPIPILRSPEITYGIRNFIGNAVKFSKKNVDIILKNDGQNTILQIADDGPGFPNDIYKIIGEPYIASNSKKLKSKSGLGLGTFIGKTLLERKKGSIEFLSSQNGGALVEITWQNTDLISN